MAINRKHIDKVFDQKFSLLDQKNLEKYFEDNQLNEETRQVVGEQWEQFTPNPESLPVLDHVYYKLYYTINSTKDQSVRGRSLFLKFSQIAAILVVGLLIAASIYFTGRGGENLNTQQVEFISHTGFRNQFKLPDGTTGWLGYGSELKYHVDSNDQRVVDLNGLAFFNVTRRQKQRFIVKTPTKLNIEVLGTRFNISAYSEDNACQVVLEQGSVRLNLNDQEVGVMIPNECVTYHSDNNSFERSNVNVHDYVAWKDGKLILNDVSLKEACLNLGRFYNAEIKLQLEGIDNQKVRLLLEDETLEDALKLLTMIVPVKYQFEERKVQDDYSYSKKKIIIKNK
ncbi:MAG TPA: FecR domain-containing protein [Prolixibacteraceae bacterium]|nr:FecR domain-containing protein [Prolixibacteraceae bacterium]